MRGRARRFLVAFLLLGTRVTAAGARASTAAEELVREARAHEASHEDDLAFRRYAEALAVDPTLAEAYLGLGAARLRTGDAREAERVYDAALSHVPGLAEARLGRARARRALGARTLADVDLALYVDATSDVGAAQQLASWYAEEARPLAQLAAWRRVLTLEERSAEDPRARHEAAVTVHALEAIVGDADAVRFPPDGPVASAVRRGLARAEARR